MQKIDLSPLNQMYSSTNIKNKANFTKIYSKQEKDNVSFCGKNKKNNDNSKITFSEGAKLVFAGAKDKTKEMILSVIKHPFKTVAGCMFATAAFSVFPLIGISSAAAAGVFGIGLAANNLFKTAKLIKTTVNNKKEGKYDNVRDNLKDIGAKSIDLALTLPFMKSSFKSVKYQAKYGKIGLNRELISDLKETKGLFSKINKIKLENSEINETINKYAGLDELQKELKFSDSVKQEYLDLYNIKDDVDFIQCAYDRLTTDLGYKHVNKNNAPQLVFLNDNVPYTATYESTNNIVLFSLKSIEKGKADRGKILEILKHELRHYQQSIDMERMQTTKFAKVCQAAKAYMYDNTLKVLENLHDSNSGVSAEDILDFKKPNLCIRNTYSLKNENGKTYGTLTSLDFFDINNPGSSFQSLFDEAKLQGPIKPLSKMGIKNKLCFNNIVKYYDVPNSISENSTLKDMIKYKIDLYKYKYLNFSEYDARNAQKTFKPLSNDIRSNVSRNYIALKTSEK